MLYFADKGGPNSTDVSIVRMSGSDPINNTVDVTLDTFFESSSMSSSQILLPEVMPPPSPVNQRNIMGEILYIIVQYIGCLRRGCSSCKNRTKDFIFLFSLVTCGGVRANFPTRTIFTINFSVLPLLL